MLKLEQREVIFIVLPLNIVHSSNKGTSIKSSTMCLLCDWWWKQPPRHCIVPSRFTIVHNVERAIFPFDNKC